jgi:hypothetical protein
MAMALGAAFVGVFAVMLGPVWFIVGLVSYRVRSFAYLFAHKALGDDIRFDAVPRTGRIIREIIFGSIMVVLLAGVIVGIPAGAVASLVAAEIVPVGLTILPGVVLYMVGSAVVSSLSLVWIVQPILTHVVTTIRVHNPDALAHIRQRAGDTGADAEGFADALDVGGAF